MLLLKVLRQGVKITQLLEKKVEVRLRTYRASD